MENSLRHSLRGAISDIFDTDLQHGEAGLLCQSQLFGVAGVGVVPVVVQPLLQDLDRVLGKVSSPPSGSRSPAGSFLGGGVLVRRRTRVPFSFVDCRGWTGLIGELGDPKEGMEDD